MNIYPSSNNIYSNVNLGGSNSITVDTILYNENKTPQIELFLKTALNIVEKEIDSLWGKLYQNTIPPFISMPTNNEIPNFYKNFPNLIIKEAKEFYMNDIILKKSPINYFLAGQYQQYILDGGKISQEALNIFKKGSNLGDPFCMMKIAEFLIRDNEPKNREKIILFLLRSFITTSIEPYKFLNSNLMINYYTSEVKFKYYNMDSFWYLCYYFDNNPNEFLKALDKAISLEKCSEKFKECIIYIFNNLHKIEEHVNILKMLDETSNQNLDKKVALHFCIFSFLIIKISNLPINLEYIISILKYIADEGNYFACEKFALYLDNIKDYQSAFNYFKKAVEYCLPLSFENLGNYYCSYKNPLRNIDLKQANEYWKNASYFGMCNSIEYLKLLNINKDNDRLFILSNMHFSSELFGSELILGECYEKGKGTVKNLKLALMFYKKGLRKHREGCGFLYRLARILEKEGSNTLYQDFYKICFIIYKNLFEEDKNNSNNMWILDAYRLASLYACGRGVNKDLQQALNFIDFILSANITLETSSYVCLFFHVLAIKKKKLLSKENFSSIMSISCSGNSNNLGPQSEESVSLSITNKKDKENFIISDGDNLSSHNSIQLNLAYSDEEKIKNKMRGNDSIRIMIYNGKNNKIYETNSLFSITKSRTENNKIREEIPKFTENKNSPPKDNENKIIELIKINNNSGSNESINSNIYLEENFISEVKKLMKESKKNKSNDKASVNLVMIQGYIENIKKNGIKLIDINNLVFDELIGNGGYSKVYSGWYNSTKVAIKEFKNVNENSIKKIFEEINTQVSLKNELVNKVLFLGIDTSPLKLCSINKYMAYNLRMLLNNNSNLKLVHKFFITKQLLEVIDYIHSQSPPIVHRDIKPENILIDEYLNMELCDFGVFKTLRVDHTISETLNQSYTVRYSPPEVIKNSHFICKASDIWSIGLVLYDLFYGQEPWNGLNSEEIIDTIKKEKPFLVKKTENVPEQITNIIKLCAQNDYSLRPKAKDLLLDITNMIYDLKLV